MDFGGEGSARKFPSSRASPPEPRAAARIASASAARAWPRRNENLERMARARREKGFCTPQARLPIRAN